MGNKEAKELSLSELLIGDTNRLRFVRRFSNSLVCHKENVAEHSWYVAFYAGIIGEWVESRGEVELDKGLLLWCALVHDLDECRSGDIIRTFKHRDYDLKTACQNASYREVATVEALLWEEKVIGPLLSSWSGAKSPTKEGRIVEFADFLSVLSYVLLELNSGNSSIFEFVDSMREYQSVFLDPGYDFIRPLCQEAQNITLDAIRYAQGLRTGFPLRREWKQS